MVTTKSYRHIPTRNIFSLDGEKLVRNLITISAFVLKGSKDWEEIVEYPIGTRAGGAGHEYIKECGGWMNVAFDGKMPWTDKDVQDMIEDKQLCIIYMNIYPTGTKIKAKDGSIIIKDPTWRYIHSCYKLGWQDIEVEKSIKSGNLILVEASKEEPEKNYQITKFRVKDFARCFNNDGVRVVNKYGNVEVSDNTMCPVETILKSCLYEIYSVKRLSDGVEFSIGDEFKYVNSGGANKIKSIRLDECTGITLVAENGNAAFQSYGFKNCIKVVIPKALYTTDDGVEIFTPTIIYVVRKETLLMSFSAMSSKPDHFAIFSKIENAHEYIFQNTRRFSLQDLKTVRFQYSLIGVPLIDTLEKIAREKK